MSILVTGGAGFIGARLCARLLGLGARVVVLDDFSLGSRDNLGAVIGNPSFRLVEGDAARAELVLELAREEGVREIHHLAANSDIARSHADPRIDRDRTFLTTFAVLEALRALGGGRLVFASTSAVYGDAPGPFSEDDGPLRPVSHYGAAKLASEGFISSYVANYGISALVLRFPNVVGPGATHGVVYDFVNKLRSDPTRLKVLGDGTQEKPYLHVDDLIDALLTARARETAGLEIFNVAGDGATSVARIADLVSSAFGARPALEFGTGARGWVGDVPRFSYDTTRIRALGWRPTRSSDEAVLAAAEALCGKGGA